MSTRKVIIYKGKLYFSDVTVPTRVSQLANDAGYVTTDEKVKQSSNDSTDAEYRILFSNTADDTERTEKIQKNSDFSFNPLKDILKIGRTSSSGGVTTTRYTTMGIPGIDISEYVGSTLWSQLSLRKDDITLLSKWDGINTSLKTAISNLHIHSYSIFTMQTASTTESTFNSYNGRKFSDYDIIIFAFVNGSEDIRDTKIFPSNEWLSGKQIIFNVLHGSAGSTASSFSVAGLVIKYNTDTSVKATLGGSGVIKNFRIFGVTMDTLA